MLAEEYLIHHVISSMQTVKYIRPEGKIYLYYFHFFRKLVKNCYSTKISGKSLPVWCYNNTKFSVCTPIFVAYNG